MNEKSVIQEFFNGKSVFITGATGFIGKVSINPFKFKKFSNHFTVNIILRNMR
jgi:FlaA1/EpsC-like NDP-sugar epimerase